MKLSITKIDYDSKEKETMSFEYDKDMLDNDYSLLDEYMESEDIGILDHIMNKEVVNFIGDDFVTELS